jgi:hypothetical protein
MGRRKSRGRRARQRIELTHDLVAKRVSPAPVMLDTASTGADSNLVSHASTSMSPRTSASRSGSPDPPW